MNKAIIIGNLTKNLELRRTQDNKAVTNFIIAVTRSFTNSNGERETDFINVIAWGKIAENICMYLGKGSKLAVDGRIQTSSYEDKDGNRVYRTDIVAENIQFLDTKGNNQHTQPQQASNTNVNNKQDMHNDANNFFDSFNTNNSEITDDNLPF